MLFKQKMASAPIVLSVLIQLVPVWIKSRSLPSSAGAPVLSILFEAPLRSDTPRGVLACSSASREVLGCGSSVSQAYRALYLCLLKQDLHKWLLTRTPQEVVGLSAD